MFFIMLFSAAILDAAQGSLEVQTRTASSLVNIAFDRVAHGIQTLAELRALQEMLDLDFPPARVQSLEIELGAERFGAIRAIANTLRPLGQAIRDIVVRLILEISEKNTDFNRLSAEELRQRFRGIFPHDTDIVSRLVKLEIERLYYLKTGQLLNPKPAGFKFGYSLSDIASAGQEIARLFVKGDVYIVMTVPANVRSHAAISSAHGLEEILRVMNIDPATIRRLNLAGNQIAALPAGIFAGLSNLQELFLAGNQIAVLPAGIFAGLSNLQNLDLHSNQIAALPAGIFAGLTNLQTLDLDVNQIAILLPGIFAGLPNLQGLYLSGNQITALSPGVFAGLSNLQQLYLSGNQIVALPAGIFAGLSNLQALHLADNQIAVMLPGIFAGLPNLQQLSLAGNQIAVLPAGIFAGLSNLGWLDLSRNQIAVLPAEIFAGLSNLGWMSLDGNRITTLPAGVFAELPSLSNLSLSGNPIAIPGWVDGLELPKMRDRYPQLFARKRMFIFQEY